MQHIFRFILIITTLTLFVPAFGQEKKEEETKKYLAIKENNDTIIHRLLEQVNIYPQKGRALNYKEYARMVVKIRKVYPLAKEASREVEKYNTLYENSRSDRERRKYVKAVEKELFAKYEDQIKHLTIPEGRYLILLIDREVGNSSYSIIKEVKGGFSAVFWQGIARIFKNNLKEEYDPTYKHYIIEQIVLMLEAEEKAKQQKKK